MPTLMTLMLMKDFGELLPPTKFVRVHRSFILPVAKVESIGSRGITLRGCDILFPIGRTYLKDCREKLG